MTGSPWILSRAAVAACIAATVALALTSAALGSGGSRFGGSSSDKGGPVTTTASAPSPSSGALTVQGVVQSVSASAVAVKLLDGTAVSIPYDRKTQVLVNGRSDRITDVKPGFVVSASWKAGKTATVLRFVRSS